MKKNRIHLIFAITILVTISAKMFGMAGSVPDTISQVSVNIFEHFSNALQRPSSPPSPNRGGSSYENIKLVNETIAEIYGFSADSPYFGPSFRTPGDDTDKSSATSDASPQQVAQTTDITSGQSDQSIQTSDRFEQRTESSQTIDRSAAYSEQADYNTQQEVSNNHKEQSAADAIWREVEQVWQDDQNTNHTMSNYHHKKLDAVDYFLHELSHYANPEEKVSYNSLGYLPKYSRAEAAEKIELLMAPSSDPTALKAQISATFGKHRFNYRLDMSTYRDFLWDSKGFIPIDSPERQERALEILYPFLKEECFYNNEPGLVSFLEKHANLRTPGAQRLLDLETGKASVSQRISNFGKNCSSTLASLNAFSRSTTADSIKQSLFLPKLSLVATLIKQKKFKKCRELLNDYRNEIYLMDLSRLERTAKIKNMIVFVRNTQLCAKKCLPNTKMIQCMLVMRSKYTARTQLLPQ